MTENAKKAMIRQKELDLILGKRAGNAAKSHLPAKKFLLLDENFDKILMLHDYIAL